jgi:hypothetical protein
MQTWTKRKIYCLIREDGATPGDMGRRGGQASGRKRRKAKAFREWNSQTTWFKED